MKLERGLVQVYTGNGKGKTTASLGLALRAVGRGLSVCIIQFMKGGEPYGEHRAAELLYPGLSVHRTGRDGWVFRDNLHPDDLAEGKRGLELARLALRNAQYDLVILDEINGAAWFGVVQVEDVLGLLAQKPPQTEVVLTGRNAHERVIAAADLVTEMREVKHYFAAGVSARHGIEM